MNSLLINQITKEFNFSSGDNCHVSVTVSIPLSQHDSFNETLHRIIETHKIPCYYEQDFAKQLKNFIDDESDKIQDEHLKRQMEEMNLSSNDIQTHFDSIINANESTKGLQDKSKDNDDCNGDGFASKYHTLVHSGFLTQPLINLEVANAIAIRDLISSRDEALHELQEKQTHQMEILFQNIGISINEDDINALSVRHFEQTENLHKKWNQTIAELKRDQRKDFHDWIDKVYEDFQKGDPDIVSPRVRSNSIASNNLMSNFGDEDEIDSLETRLEESFTIKLGAQMKTTHNLRLISMDILDLCRDMNLSKRSTSLLSPHRIQTAMSLYSHSLSAMVLLVDNRVNSFSGIKLEFAKICSSSTEFHFDELERQLELVRNKITNCEDTSPDKLVTLSIGDFYITKHSNLSEIHVVYHLVSDDSLTSSDINSRHAVILGLRNILKVAHLNDISNISIPLLLIHELTQDMTLQWCLKRAELVLKCVKGFMIEMASLSNGSDENRTVQFVVPKGISEEFFTSLSSMLPSIFRLSNPLILQSN